jgi:hypothetical protein
MTHLADQGVYGGDGLTDMAAPRQIGDRFEFSDATFP